MNELVLLKVFSYLPHEALEKASAVCSEWRSLADETLRKRPSSVQVQLHKTDEWPNHSYRDKLEADAGRLRRPPDAALVFFVDSTITRFMRPFRERPRSQSPASSSSSSSPAKRRHYSSMNMITAHLCHLLPDKMQAKVFVCAPALTGTCLETGVAQELEREPCLSNLILSLNSTHARVIVKYGESLAFSASSSSVSSQATTATAAASIRTKRDLYNYIGVDETNESLKLLVVLANTSTYNQAVRRAELSELLASLNAVRRTLSAPDEDFAVTGGCVSKIKVFTDEAGMADESSVCIVALVARTTTTTTTTTTTRDDKHAMIRVAQVVVADMDASAVDAALDAQLARLKRHFISNSTDSAKVGGDAFCLKINCVGRGGAYYNKSNHEATVFRKHFPSMPLVGFYGFGEIGHDFLPDNPTNNNNNNNNKNDRKTPTGDKKAHSDIEMLEYSSVYTIVHFANT